MTSYLGLSEHSWLARLRIFRTTSFARELPNELVDLIENQMFGNIDSCYNPNTLIDMVSCLQPSSDIYRLAHEGTKLPDRKCSYKNHSRVMSYISDKVLYSLLIKRIIKINIDHNNHLKYPGLFRLNLGNNTDSKVKASRSYREIIYPVRVLAHLINNRLSKSLLPESSLGFDRGIGQVVSSDQWRTLIYHYWNIQRDYLKIIFKLYRYLEGRVEEEGNQRNQYMGDFIMQNTEPTNEAKYDQINLKLVWEYFYAGVSCTLDEKDISGSNLFTNDEITILMELPENLVKNILLSLGTTDIDEYEKTIAGLDRFKFSLFKSTH